MRFSNDETSTAYTEYLDALEYDEALQLQPGSEPERAAAPPDEGSYRTAAPPILQ